MARTSRPVRSAARRIAARCRNEAWTGTVSTQSLKGLPAAWAASVATWSMTSAAMSSNGTVEPRTLAAQ
jgi:hypothetical protein